MHRVHGISPGRWNGSSTWCYCHEWWCQEGGNARPGSEEEAISQCFDGAPLHPEYTWFWDDLTCGDIAALADTVSRTGELRHGILVLPPEPGLKGLLEEILLPHRVREGMICISEYYAFLACLGLDLKLRKRSAWEDAPMDDPLALVQHLSGFVIRSRGGAGGEPVSAVAWADPGSRGRGR